MKVTDYSIDYLHQAALAEAEERNDLHTQAVLNEVYAGLTAQYQAAVEALNGSEYD